MSFHVIEVCALSVASAESRLFVKVYMVPCNPLSYFIDRNSAPEQCLAGSL